MDVAQHHLLTYDALPAAERSEVDAYLAEHPDAFAIVEEGRVLRALLDDVAGTGAEVPDAEAVAHYVAAQSMAHRPLPPDLAALGRRIEASFAAHPEVERQYSIMRDRLQALTAAAESPSAQFERLTGYRPGSAPPLGLDEPEELPDHARQPVSRLHSWRAPANDREAAPLLQRLSLPRLAMAATLLVALVYGGLFLASNAQQTEFERLADLDDVPAEYEGLRLRGVDGLMDPAAERYAAALDRLNAARQTTLGLFPTYDEAELDTTLRLLNEVTELDDPNAALGLESQFLIGKILLYQHEVEAARDAFQIVVDRRGPSAPDARRLLDALGGRSAQTGPAG